jgi:tetratricopeptide (TPR) repeat protein
LVGKLSSQDRQQLASRPTEDFEAYQLYLRGRFAWNKRKPEHLQQSIKFYQAAIDREPTFAHAYAGLADSYSLLGDSVALSAHDAYPKAKAAAIRALEINENLAEAHTSLAWVLQTYEWDWAGAEREYRRAIELNPNYATAHQWYAEFLMAMGRHEEAIAEIRRAKELDPLSIVISGVEGWLLFHARDYDRSLEQYRKTIELDPKFNRLWEFPAKIYEQKEDYENAIAAHRRAVEIKGGSPVEQDALEEAYEKFGVKGYWEKRLEILQRQQQISAIRFYNLAEIYVRLGDKEKAFTHLEKSLKEREYSIINLKVSPNLDNLRGEPRYKEILRKMNL